MDSNLRVLKLIENAKDLAVHDADAFKAISDKANRIRECLMGDTLSDLSNSAIQEINECSSSNDLESIRVNISKERYQQRLLNPYQK